MNHMTDFDRLNKYLDQKRTINVPITHQYNSYHTNRFYKDPKVVITEKSLYTRVTENELVCQQRSQHNAVYRHTRLAEKRQTNLVLTDDVLTRPSTTKDRIMMQRKRHHSEQPKPFSTTYSNIFREENPKPLDTARFEKIRDAERQGRGYDIISARRIIDHTPTVTPRD